MRQPRAELLEVRPGLRPKHRQVEDGGVQPHRHERIERHRRGQHPVLPTRPLQPLREHPQEAGVGFDHRQADVLEPMKRP